MTKETRKKKAVGYTRVSTPRQAKKGESLLTQETAIRRYAEAMGYDLVEIYSDEGISGGTVAGRPALKRLLTNLDGIDCLIVSRLSRLGRNSRELLNNVNDLQIAGLEIVFTEDNIDLSTAHGRALLTILSAVAQLERDIIAETSIENKIARCKRNIPATGKIPWGRHYDKDKDEWSIIPEKQEIFEQITDAYINGESLKEICKRTPKRFHLSYSNYLRVIENAASDTWEVNFKKEKLPVKIKVPPLLTSDKIKKALQLREFNTSWNRHDVKRRYLLSGFIRCAVCNHALVGQTQIENNSENTYRYYRHHRGIGEICKAVSSLSGSLIEKAVLEAIWDNVIDEKGFNHALSESLPDKKDRAKVEEKITKINSKLDTVDNQLSKLAVAVIEGTLTKETIKSKETELLKEKAFLNSTLIDYQSRLSRMADPVKLEDEARQIRSGLLDYFGSIQHFKSMDFERKRQLLHAMFDGEDVDGNKRGIYITKLGNRKYEYFVLATVFQGVRVMFKRNLDYYNENDPEMPEYGIRDRLKDQIRRRRRPRTKSIRKDIKTGEPDNEKFVEINGIKRKRKF